MNEDHIERWFAGEMDVLEADLMNGIVSEKEYYKCRKELIQQLNDMYRELDRRDND